MADQQKADQVVYDYQLPAKLKLGLYFNSRSIAHVSASKS